MLHIFITSVSSGCIPSLGFWEFRPVIFFKLSSPVRTDFLVIITNSLYHTIVRLIRQCSVGKYGKLFEIERESLFSSFTRTANRSGRNTPQSTWTFAGVGNLGVAHFGRRTVKLRTFNFLRAKAQPRKAGASIKTGEAETRCQC